MKPHIRRAVAYIAACVISKKNAGSIFDYTASNHFSFSINLTEGGIAAYDYTQQCHISGGYSSLYHYGDQHHISLNLEGSRFSGYDYGSQCHFSGTVNGGSVSLYDYGLGSHFNYSI